MRWSKVNKRSWGDFGDVDEIRDARFHGAKSTRANFINVTEIPRSFPASWG
jgi:hypothetical protein